MELPVYLFCGFLESGKTQFISEVIDDETFSQGERTLLLICEEGINEYDPALLARTNTVPVIVEDLAQMTPAWLTALQLEHKPERAIIEWNGMWPIEALPEQVLPPEWIIYQMVSTINAATYLTYSANMGSLMFSHIANADLVVLNRASDADKAAIREKKIHAINPRATIFFEDADGTAEDYKDGLEPDFDMDAPVIEISDLDFGLWYVDAMNNPAKYEGKTVSIKGMVYRGKDFPENQFVPGRFAMVCCADDVTFVGFICNSDKASEFATESWVQVTATVKTEFYPQYKGEGPVLYATSIVPAEKPDPELVYFGS